MQEEKNNNKYSAEFIRKYLDGELPDREMQALEKDALEDPFLADVIEGLEESRKHVVSFESGVADLKTRLAQRINQRDIRKGLLFQLTKWPVAASFLLVIGLAIFMITYVNREPKISKTNARTDSAAITFNKPPLENSIKNDTIKTDEQAIASVRPRDIERKAADIRAKTSRKIAHEPFPYKITGNPTAGEPAVSKADTIREREKSEAFAKKEMAVPPATDAAKSNASEGRVSGINIEPGGGQQGYYIKGLVINDMGKPVPYAKVNIKGSDRHVFTDTGGFFKLYMKNPKLAALVYLQPSGYASASAELIPDSNITNTIQLHSARVESDTEMSPNDKISPFVIGWDAFYHFIDSNKKINTKDSLMKGEEVVSFTLYSDGRLSPIRIEQSLSNAHDKEILRLISLAPMLKLQEKKRIRCTLHIQFK